MNTTKSTLLTGILLVVSLFSVRPMHAQTTKRNATEKLILKIDSSGMTNHSYSISNDMSRIAFRTNVGNKQMAVIDGIKGKTYDAVNPVIFSSNGKRFAYSVKNGSKWQIIVDNKMEASIDSVTGISAIQFSPDGSSYVYLVNVNKKVYLVANGINGKVYDYINENSIAFSSDNLTIAYSARRGKFQVIVKNGIEGYSYDEVGFPVFSSNGKHMAYWAKRDRQSYAVIDDQASKPYDEVYSTIFSPDGKHYAYHAVLQGKHFVVSDGRENEQCELIHSLKFNADGTQLVYAMESIVVDQDGSRQFVVVNGTKTGPYETVMEGSLQFSPDGKHFAYKASRHNEFLFVVDGKEGTYYSDVLQVTAAFSPDNLHFAYAAEVNTKRLVVTDGTESTPYNDIYFIVFSPDSRRVVYSVRNGNEEKIIVDDSTGKAYDSILGQGAVVFDSLNSFHYLAQKDNEIYLVTETF